MGDWQNFDNRAVIGRALRLRREIDEFESRWPSSAMREENLPTFSWEQLERQLVDLAATRVTRRGEEVRLTPTEWHLLEVLVRHPGMLLSQRRLLTEVWGAGYETAQGNLRLYVSQLRRKLEPDPAQPRFFRTEPGMGYRFQPEG